MELFQNLPAIPEEFRFFPRLAQHQVPTFDESKEYELFRLSTFRDWPLSHKVSSVLLAKAGLYYTGNDTETRCFMCGVTISDWEENLDVIQQHRLNNPTCPLVVTTDTRNKPMVSQEAGVQEVASFVAPPVARVDEETASIVIPPTARVEEGQGLSDCLTGSASRTDDRNPLSGSSSMYPVCQLKGVAKSQEQNDGVKATEAGLPNPSDMMVESNRLETFRTWPSSYVNPEVLAKNGFFYIGSGDRVQCAYCNGVLRDWEPGDDVAEEHQRHFGQYCSFVKQNFGKAGLKASRSASENRTAMMLNAKRNTQSQTKAMGLPQESPSTKSSQPTQGQQSRPHVSSRPLSRLPAGPGQTGQPPVQSSLPRLGQQHQLPLSTAPVPQHPQYADFELRWRTFNSWPRNSPLSPNKLAVAGFFYGGHDDNVRCFHCDGGLRNWEPDDDPWIEHARWFPRCQHVIEIKGQAFVDQVERTNPPGHQAPVSPGRGRVPGRGEESCSAGQELPLDQCYQRQALDMGFSQADIRRAVHTRHVNTGRGFADLQSLLDALLDELPETGGQPTTTQPRLPQEVAAGSTSQSNFGSRRDKEGQEERKKEKKKAGNGDHVPPEPVEKEESHTLREENRQLKEQRTCKVCMDEEVNVVFLPCGHLVCCSNCAPALRTCPICRALIRGNVKTFLS